MTSTDAQPLGNQEWTERDERRIAKTVERPGELAAWRRGDMKETAVVHDWTAYVKERDELELEVTGIHNHYVPRWRKDAYVPDMAQCPGSDAVPCVHVYGRLPEGHSVCARVWNFHPYFYVRAETRLSDEAASFAAEELKGILEEVLDSTRNKSSSDWRQERLRLLDAVEDQELFDHGSESHHYARRQLERLADRDPGPCVMSVEPVSRIDITDVLEQDLTFFRVTVRVPRMVSVAREMAMTGIRLPGSQLTLSAQTYESNIRFENRLMLDTNIVGGGWAVVDAESCELVNQGTRTSRCDLEFDVDYRALHGLSDDKEQDRPDGLGAKAFSRPSQFRVMSYDLECAGRPGRFPDARLDPIIQAAATCWRLGSKGERCDELRVIFVVGSCLPLRGTRLFCYKTEREMLNGFGRFIQAYDPDLITGYNILNFDNPYALDRAEVTGADEFLMCGRHLTTPLRKREKVQKSRNYGNRKHYDVTMEGRVMVDMLPYMQQNFKLRSYRLNAVAAHLLGDQKEDVDPSMITPLQKGSAKDRQRLAIYCVKDTVLPKDLALKTQAFPQMVEQARATGVQMSQIQGSGSSAKSMSALLREMIRDGNLVMPYQPNQEAVDYEGANVFVPKPNFYKKPVAVLDFTSLYPSIIQAHNLCPHTYIRPSLLSHFDEADYEKCPAGHHYLRKHVRQGIVPRVLERLLSLRKSAKREMAEAERQGDKDRQAQQNCRQLALKIVANSVYGFTGLPTSVYFWYVAESTTAWGRDQIRATQRMIEQNFTRAKGYPFDAVVVYGDTDSVMVYLDLPIDGDYLDPKGPTDKFPPPSAATKSMIARAIEYAHEMAQFCTDRFVKPNRLEFENIYWPYLLLNRKKRYAGPFWENADKPSKTKIRGLESERRDNCQAATNAQRTCLDSILYELDPEKACAHARNEIRRLRSGEMDLSELVISQRLNKRQNDMTAQERVAMKKRLGAEGYKEECERRDVYSVCLPHAEVDRIMKKRTGMGYNLNDRVPYIIADKSLDKNANQVYKRAEDPLYFLEHDMLPDLEYYTTQIINCTANVLTPVYEDADPNASQSKLTDVFHTTASANNSRGVKRPRENDAPPAKERKQLSIMSFMGEKRARLLADPSKLKKTVRRPGPTNAERSTKQQLAYGELTKRMLRHGEHMRSIYRKRRIDYASGGLSRHVKSQGACIGCRTAMAEQTSQHGICAACKPRAATITRAFLRDFEAVDQLSRELWNTCRICQSKDKDMAQGQDDDDDDEEEGEKNAMDVDVDVQDQVDSCRATTCSIFFKRTVTQRKRDDLAPIASKLKSLNW